MSVFNEPKFFTSPTKTVYQTLKPLNPHLEIVLQFIQEVRDTKILPLKKLSEISSGTKAISKNSLESETHPVVGQLRTKARPKKFSKSCQDETISKLLTLFQYALCFPALRPERRQRCLGIAYTQWQGSQLPKPLKDTISLKLFILRGRKSNLTHQYRDMKGGIMSDSVNTKGE